MNIPTIFFYTVCLLILFSKGISAQFIQTQTVYGRILDKETKRPILGALVFVDDVYPIVSALTDADGVFYLNDVPIGRQSLKVSKRKYKKYFTNNLLVRSSGATYREIELIQFLSSGKEDIKQGIESRENTPVGLFTRQNTRSFTAENIERYPNSYNDPGRMAMAFPATQGYWDGRSDLSIQGLPFWGLGWTIEGVEVEHLNHFSTIGQVGGGISMLSVAVLGESDMGLGEIPNQHSNALSGVFDLKMKQGNLLKNEYSFGLGLLGLNFTVEGPIQKERSSFLINYRYSTLGVLNKLGLQLLGDNVENSFQDLSFALQFRSRNNRNVLNLFGVGGRSDENWIRLDAEDQVTDFHMSNQQFKNKIGLIGLNVKHILNKSSYIEWVAAFSGFYHYNKKQGDFSSENRLGLKHRNVNCEPYFKIRYTNRIIQNLLLQIGGKLKPTFAPYTEKIAYDYANAQLDTAVYSKNVILPSFDFYAQVLYRFSEKFSVRLGTTLLYHHFSRRGAVNPRFCLAYKIRTNSKLSLTGGAYSKNLHSTVHLQHARNRDTSGQTISLKIPTVYRSILSYRQVLPRDVSVQVDGFFNYLTNVPASDNQPGFWMFNDVRSNYLSSIQFNDKGKGLTYGGSFILEKVFTKDIFFILTTSVYRSLYKTNNQEEWKGSYLDNKFGGTLLGAKEWTFKKGGALQIGARFVVHAGTRYRAVNEAQTIQYANETIDDEQPYRTAPFYFRPDLRIAYRKDNKKSTFVFSLDIQNAVNIKNKRTEFWNYQTQNLNWRYQSSLIPVFNFRVNI